MSLVSCRECGQQISTEATACPACGVPGPSSLVKAPRASRRWLLVGASVLAVLVLLRVGAAVFHPAPQELDGASIAAEIRSGLPAERAYCPARVPETEGKIVDCIAQSGSGHPVSIRVTLDDSDGHFHYERTTQKPAPDPEFCADMQRSMEQVAADLAARHLTIAERGSAAAALDLQMRVDSYQTTGCTGALPDEVLLQLP